MIILSNERIGIKRLIACGLLTTVLYACNGENEQSEILPIDGFSVDQSGTVALLRSDTGKRYELCGVRVPEGFEDAVKTQLQRLLATPDVDIMLQGAGHGTYEAFLVGLDREAPLEESLLLKGLLVTSKNVMSCPNGEARDTAQAIAQEEKKGVWAVSSKIP